MALQITTEFVDPRSEAARARGARLILATSPEGLALDDLLRQYAQGSLSGHCVLVSGHRGSGKTTLVWHAIRKIEAALEGAGRMLLPITLYGPDLFPTHRKTPTAPSKKPETARPPDGVGTAVAAVDPQTGGPVGAVNDTGGGQVVNVIAPAIASAAGEDAGETTPIIDEPKAEITDTAAFLVAILESMYRQLSRTFSDAIRESVARRGDAHREAMEAANYFEQSTDLAPESQAVRACWAQLGLLDKGALFSVAQQPERPRDQAWREILAFSSAAAAYRKVIGNLTITKTAKGTLTLRFAAPDQPAAIPVAAPAVPGTPEATTSNVVRDAMSAVLGIAGGVAGYEGLAMPDENNLPAALFGVALGAITLFGARKIYARTFEKTKVDDTSLSIKCEPETLTRDLPRLIDRVRACGLQPVLVFDELDKIEDLAAAMNDVMRQVKGLLNDRVFCAFLCDRDYYDFLEDRDERQPYARETTFFAQKLFVSYRPVDFARFVFRAIESRTSSRTPEEELRDVNARLILPYYVIQRARMHSGRARAELLQLGRDPIFSDIAASRQAPQAIGAVSSLQRFAWPVAMQAAIHFVIENQPALLGRMQNDAYFTQQIYDALYYPARMWRKGKDILDLRIDPFAKYMSERIDPDAMGNRQKTVFDLTSADHRLLYRSVKAVVECLVKPAAFRSWLERKAVANTEAVASWSRDRNDDALPDISVAVRDLVFSALDQGEPLSEVVKGEEPTYRWELTEYGGQTLSGAATTQAPAPRNRRKDPVSAPAPASSSDKTWQKFIKETRVYQNQLRFIGDLFGELS